MQKILHKSDTRGRANHEWLDARYSFSFASYHNPKRMHFGVLRVLNDDRIDGGKGFGTHPHDNMEIITIPLEGDLEHKDNMGNGTIIRSGDIQVMSAGKGIQHSEHNPNPKKEVRLLQIWLFPKTKNVIPRYQQISLKDIEIENDFYQILSPNKEDQGVWIHQDAWFHLGKFSQEKNRQYQVKKQGNGVYVFVLEGEIEIENQRLKKRDALGISRTDGFIIKTNAGAKVLLMEVPMQL